uniref:Uncharacterized protein n=2 Tax=Lutzomyia longipalpis TaxID=7200 RepID=A0A1B0GKL2_LUTLO
MRCKLSEEAIQLPAYSVERQPNHREVVTLDALNECPTHTLNPIASGFIQGLPGVHIRMDLLRCGLAKVHICCLCESNEFIRNLYHNTRVDAMFAIHESARQRKKVISMFTLRILHILNPLLGQYLKCPLLILGFPYTTPSIVTTVSAPIMTSGAGSWSLSLTSSTLWSAVSSTYAQNDGKSSGLKSSSKREGQISTFIP